MGRPFVSLALVFALILAGAGGLILWSERDQRQAASDPVGQPVGIASGTSGSAAPGAAPHAQTAEKGPADAEVAGGPAPTEAEVACRRVSEDNAAPRGCGRGRRYGGGRS
jgi:hypothetical protein